MYAIIGGTGIYNAFNNIEKIEVGTEYGIVLLDKVVIDKKEIYFLSRHGKDHSVYPHQIDFRANISALKKLNVKYIFATAAVGSMNNDFEPGDIVLIEDFIDFTHSRLLTTFDNDGIVRHTDMSDPYCYELRNLLSKNMNLIKGSGVYVTTNGPRFETKAEIRMYSSFGDFVGMTNAQEVTFAKELGMHYSAIGIVTNWCTGFNGEISIHDINGLVSKNKDYITSKFIDIIRNENFKDFRCTCENSVMEL
jgi:5'-methylthioadenosine phosphorylase